MHEHKRTVLYDWHVSQGANMAPFGQYEMPLWYRQGVKAEHLAVIQHCGLFDTSHMAVVMVEGEGSRELLQYCFSKDLERSVGIKRTPLVDGRAVYGIFLNPDATVLDDAIIFQLSSKRYMVVVNAGMGAGVAAHLVEHNGNYSAAISDLTDTVGKIDIQGPDAARVLKKVVNNPEQLFEQMFYFSFKGSLLSTAGPTPVSMIDTTPLMVSRTGYTGEFGFELFMARDHMQRIWQMLLEAGEEFFILPCGLAARDSLRAGASLPLSHQDIGDFPFAANPWKFAVAFDDDEKRFTKEFVGSKTLESLTVMQHTLIYAGYNPRKVVVTENSFVTDLDGNRLGTILTCATDMAIDRVDNVIYSVASPVDTGRPENFTPKGLSCGFVLLDEYLQPGSEVYLTDGGKKKIKVEIRQEVRPGRSARLAIKDMF